MVSYRVPKRDLVGGLQVLLQSGRLKIASSLEHAETLRAELLNFRVKINLCNRPRLLRGVARGRSRRPGASRSTGRVVCQGAWAYHRLCLACSTLPDARGWLLEGLRGAPEGPSMGAWRGPYRDHRRDRDA